MAKYCMLAVLENDTIHLLSAGGYGCWNIKHLRNINWLRLC